jgi:chromosome partitioning protein
MRVWAAVSQKGGSGKSTIILHLAIAADRGQPHRVRHRPRSAEVGGKWAALRERKTKADDPIVVHGLPSQLDSMLDKARETGHELVLIDTPAGHRQDDHSRPGQGRSDHRANAHVDPR